MASTYLLLLCTCEAKIELHTFKLMPLTETSKTDQTNRSFSPKISFSFSALLIIQIQYVHIIGIFAAGRFSLVHIIGIFAADIMRDVVLWRRKKLSIVVVLVATAIWVVMEVYQFNFITVASWVAMFVVTSIFSWGNLLRLFNKEPPNMAALEIKEESAMEMTRLLRSWIEERIRWMFRVGAEGDVFTFGGTLAALWVASKVGSFFDLITFLYIGTVVGMSVPAIYVKYEDKVKEYGEGLRMQCKRFHGMIDDKVIRKMKNKVVGERKKENKIDKVVVEERKENKIE